MVEYAIVTFGGIVLAIGLIAGTFIVIGKGATHSDAEKDLKKQVNDMVGEDNDLTWFKK